MTVRVAINGFGRIGRLVLRTLHETRCEDVEIVAINDLGPVATNAHLLKYDRVHGRFPADITASDTWIDIGRGKVAVSAERDPAQLPWRSLGIDVALECTGKFTKRETAAKHIARSRVSTCRTASCSAQRRRRATTLSSRCLRSMARYRPHPRISCGCARPRWNFFVDRRVPESTAPPLAAADPCFEIGAGRPGFP